MNKQRAKGVNIAKEVKEAFEPVRKAKERLDTISKLRRKAMEAA